MSDASSGNGLDMPPDLGLVQLNSAHPSGIERATHVADFMDSALKRADSTANECPQQVIRGHRRSFELLYNRVDHVDLQHFVPRVVAPVKLRRGWTDGEPRQVDQIDIGCILHVEERALPLPA